MTTVDEIRAALDAAVKELNALCNGQHFRMCIPVQDTDSDIVIGKALRNVGELLAEVDRLRAIEGAAREYVASPEANHTYIRVTQERFRVLATALAAYDAAEGE